MRIRLLLPGLLLSLAATAQAAERAKVNFAEHIAPIVHAKYTMCHREGQAGSFELITYEQVRKHAGTIQAVVADSYMPPWKLTNTNLGMPTTAGFPTGNDGFRGVEWAVSGVSKRSR